MFISFEGLDGSGKSTQINLLQSKLQLLGYSPLLFREPGGTEISEEIRSLLLNHKHSEMTPVTEVMLFFASRAQLMSEKIIPALQKNTIVIADRFVDSSFAYQGFGKGISMELLESLARHATQNMMPDVTFLLDIDFAQSQLRQDERGKKDRMENMPEELWNRIRNGYHQLAKQNTNRWVIIDAKQSQHDIHDQIWTHLQKLKM